MIPQNKHAKISVIIPLYNKKEYIKRALNSILNQSCQDFEILVVDDGSTDGGDKLVETIRDPRICLIRQENAGASAARNAGIGSAKGDWISFLDADDEWEPHALETFQGLISRYPNVHWAASSYTQQMPTGKWCVRTLPKSFGTEHELLVQDALSIVTMPFICTNTVFIRHNVFNEVGRFDTKLRTGEDTDMWFRIAVRYPQVAYSRSVVAVYYDAPSSLVKDCDEQFPTSQKLIEKYQESLQCLHPHRQALVHEIIKKRIHFYFISRVNNGQKAEAIDFLRKNEKFLSSKKRLLYTFYGKLPLFLLKLRLRFRLFRYNLLSSTKRNDFNDTCL